MIKLHRTIYTLVYLHMIQNEGKIRTTKPRHAFLISHFFSPLNSKVKVKFGNPGQFVINLYAYERIINCRDRSCRRQPSSFEAWRMKHTGMSAFTMLSLFASLSLVVSLVGLDELAGRFPWRSRKCAGHGIDEVCIKHPRAAR